MENKTKDTETYSKILSEENLAAILAQAEHDGMLLDFVLILDLGLSRGEILGLKWGDIDFESNKITINRLVVARSGVTHVAQADAPHEIPMMDVTAKLLFAHKGDAMQPEDFLIPSPSGRDVPFNPSAYRKKIAKVTSKALNGEGITIEVLGLVLSAICDRASRGEAAEREEVLALALEKSRNHTAVELKYRKAGTGYVKQIGPNTWQGRYTPTISGKRISKNVYAATKAECEEKLAAMIDEMNKDLGRKD